MTAAAGPGSAEPSTGTGTGSGAGHSGLTRLLPGVQVLRHYQRRWLRGDLLAGVTVAAYLVPQVMAYAGVAGLPPVTGLWAIVGPLALYTFLGSSRQLSVGPESTTALMTATAIATLAPDADPRQRATLAAVLALTVAMVCFVGWASRLGFLSQFFSKPVLLGYMTGIAVLMIISQLGRTTRIATDGRSTYREISSLVANSAQFHWPTAVLAVAVLAALLLMEHFASRWPGPLIAMVVSAGVVAALGLTGAGIGVVGQVPAGLPPFGPPDFSGIPWREMVPVAVGVGLVGYTDNVLTGRSFATRQGREIDPDQEFLALAAANAAAGLSGGFPVSSSGSRTALGAAMGSRTQLASVVSLACVLATLFFLGPVIGAFPSAALGAVVIFAALKLIDLREWRRVARFRRSELILAILTAAGVIAFDVLIGIAIAVGLSIIDLLRRLTAPAEAVLGRVPGTPGMYDTADTPAAQPVPGLVVYRYDAPLFFANSVDFRRRALQAALSADTPTRWFLLNAEANGEVDLTAGDEMEQLRRMLDEHGIRFAIARLNEEAIAQLERAGIIDAVGRDYVFPTLPTAISAYEEWSRHHPVASSDAPRSPAEGPSGPDGPEEPPVTSR
ncbi:SulP family inorganic anion transporter [Raineyella sp.]|uniref:SulP family inorganic anion transporter n=1 Tax=Raineyella sp. TaxID=1911550 RepID=UPI002B20E240|nr:sulfate permease [Raineyella sp.]MEA5155816.1 sulfate permease [Raineyella sp.]